MVLVFDGRRHGNNIKEAFDGRRFRYMTMVATNAPYGNNESATMAEVSLLQGSQE